MNKSLRTAFLYHPDCLLHRTDEPGLVHPERPERLQAVLSRLTESGLLDSLVKMDVAEVEEEWLLKVHTKHHLNRVKNSAGKSFHFFDADTYSNPHSYRSALLAAGAVVKAIDAVVGGEVDNAFCAVRPPGHHAESDRVMGFCLFNNVAVGARYLQHRHGLRKVLIVDWDVHHGNGTQEIFENDPSVFYLSSHQFPFYPGSGAQSESGVGAGEGFTANVALAAQTGAGRFLEQFREVFLPAVEQFRPDFVLISAGFDAHEADPLAQINLTTETFVELTSIVKEAAAKHCGNRLVSVLEGGYNLSALAACVEIHLRTLMEAP